LAFEVGAILLDSKAAVEVVLPLDLKAVEVGAFPPESKADVQIVLPPLKVVEAGAFPAAEQVVLQLDFARKRFLPHSVGA
jgi:hypothetical protein